MTTPAVLKLDPVVPPEEYFLPPEKLISGNPKQTVWVHYTDPSKQFFVGIWRSEPGKWRISYTEEEYCHMIEGISIIANEVVEPLLSLPGRASSFLVALWGPGK